MPDETVERRRGEIRTAERLTAIEGKLEGVAEAVERIDHAIVGKAGAPGYEVRLDRLEQRARRHDYYHGLWLAGLIAFLARVFSGWV